MPDAWTTDWELLVVFFEHKISIQKPNMFRWPASRTASDASTRMKKAARAHLKDARNIWNMLEHVGTTLESALLALICFMSPDYWINQSGDQKCNVACKSQQCAVFRDAGNCFALEC